MKHNVQRVIDASSVVQAIRARRACGVVHCAIEARDYPDPDVAFHLLTGVEPEAADGRWKPIDPPHAERIAARILQRDLAYGGAIMPEKVARELARSFVSLAPVGARMLTNAPDLAEAAETWEWVPATSAAYDAGVLVLGRGFAAVLWVEDSD